MQKDFLSIRDLSVYEFGQMLDQAAEVKKHQAKYRKALKNKILAMIFQKPSLRTRMTFEAGMLRLGARPFISPPPTSRWAAAKAPMTSAKTSSAGWTGS